MNQQINLNDMINEYRQILFDKYKKYADTSQAMSAMGGGTNYLNHDLFNLIDNSGGIYSQHVRYDMYINITDREKELLKYFDEQGLTKHTETIKNDSGRTYDVIKDDTEKFINETVIDEDFRKKINEYTSSKEFDDIYKNNIAEEIIEQPIENNKPKNKKYKATKGPKIKPKAQKTNELILKEQLEQSAKEVAEKNTKQVSKASLLPKKSLSGGGKMAIGIAVAGLIIGGALASSNNNSNKKQKNKKPHSLPKSTNTEEIDNSYAMQMAQDISSYRYGKHMTGFVNY